MEQRDAQQSEKQLGLSVACAAERGASRLELVKVAAQILCRRGAADRIGVWMRTADNDPGFRGVVTSPQNEIVPESWNSLSPADSLPISELMRGKTVERELDHLAGGILGVLAGMYRVLWLPVGARGRLYGVILAASGQQRATFPRELLESVAAELALSAELEDERRVNRERSTGSDRGLAGPRTLQSRLLQTEKMAALGQMLSGIAHELSNPLTSILGYAQRLLQRDDVAGRSAEARQIFHEAERANTMLRQILMTARDSRPERRKVSLNQVVTRTLELQRFSLAQEKIRVELGLDPEPPLVLGDFSRLQQILINLIANSQHAIMQQAAEGIIRLRTRHLAGNRVLLEVSDDGPGIPDAILGRIFDPFFTTKPEGEGTGLGLSVALAIVREHGGHVHVQSQPSGGAVFTLDFPAYSSNSRLAERRKSRAEQVTGEARLEAESGQPEAHASSPNGRNNRPRVLILEDEPTVARLIADVLEEEGCRVDILLDSREAMQRATTRRYDLAVCDMKMPGIGGQDFYEALVRSGNPLRDRLLFVTGDVIAAQTHAFLRRSQRPHVAKPFRVEELTQKVRQVLAEINTGASPNTTFRSNTASE